MKLTGDFLEPLWKQLGATSDLWEGFRGLALDGDTSLFLGGDFSGTLSVDGCTPRTSAGDFDAYLMKRKQ